MAFLSPLSLKPIVGVRELICAHEFALPEWLAARVSKEACVSLDTPHLMAQLASGQEMSKLGSNWSVFYLPRSAPMTVSPSMSQVC